MRLEKVVQSSLALASMLVLAGCELHLDLNINGDGSGTISSTVEITPADRQLGLTPAQIRKEMEEDAARRQQHVQIATGKLENGNDYVRSTAAFQSAQELSRQQRAQYVFAKHEEDGAVSFRLLDPGLVHALVPVTVQITMPGKIISSNADSYNGRTARWSDAAVRRLAGSSYGLIVTSEPTIGSVPTTLLVAMAVTVVIAATGFYLRRRPAPHGTMRRARAAAAGTGSSSTHAHDAYCGDCGAAIRTTSRFCPKCGTEL